jgi:hypothetical protein
MTWKRLAVLCAIGLCFWGLVIVAAVCFGWGVAGQWAVLMVIAGILVGAIWIKVEEDQEYLDELEAQREAEGLELADEEPPHAA